MSIYYNVPTVKENTRIPVNTFCVEVNGALNYTIDLVHTPGETELYLENTQYVSLDANYTSIDGTNTFVNPGTKLYFLYAG
jgi:hypothetical protein